MYVMGGKLYLISFNFFMWKQGQYSYNRYVKRGNIV